MSIPRETPGQRLPAVPAALAVFAGALLLYLLSVAPVVTFVDSGELAAAVATRGVSHPSGSPLYLLLCDVVRALPFRTLIWRLNAFSALCGAACVALTFACYRIFLLREDAPLEVKPAARSGAAQKGKQQKKTKPAKEPAAAPPALRPAWGIGAVAAALAMATNRALWSTATVTEVYALHASLIALLGCLLALHAREAGRSSTPSWKYLGPAAFVAALGASNYPPYGIVGPAVLVFLWRVEGGSFLFKWRRTLIVAAFFAAGLLPYALLPLRAAADPLMNWGNPSNWERFWKHVSAQQYSVFLGAPRLKVLPNALHLWWKQWPAGIWLLQLPGFFALRRRQPAAAAFTGVLAATNLLYVMCYDITDVSSAPSDYYVYLLPLCWCSSLWIGAGAAWLVQWAGERRWRPAAAAAAAILPLAAIPLHWSEMDRSRYTYADDFARSILTSVAPNALILSPDWTFVSPAMYLQEGENVRPDVLVLDGELLRRSWYFRYLQKRSPEMYALCQPEIEAFLTELRKYEEGLPYDGGVITGKYIALLNGLLQKGASSGHPPYILLNLQARESDPDNYRAMEAQLRRPPYLTTGVVPDAIGFGFQWVPETPAFRLYSDSSPHALPDVNIPVRPFSKGGDYDNVTEGVVDRYADFWRYRGDYLRAAGDCGGAVSAYRKALDLADSPESQSGLAACGAR